MPHSQLIKIKTGIVSQSNWNLRVFEMNKWIDKWIDK